MYEDKSIRVSAGTYKILRDIKERTGKPIKRILSDMCVDLIFPKTKKK